MVPKHKAITKPNSTKRLPSSQVQAAELWSIRVFSFLSTFSISPPAWIFWKSHMLNFNHCLWTLHVFNRGVRWLLWYRKRLGFWISHHLAIFLINSFLFFFCCSLKWKTKPIIRLHCPPFPHTFLCPNTTPASKVFKVGFCLFLLVCTYCVQHRRGYDLPSIPVCLAAIFCQAQTM